MSGATNDSGRTGIRKSLKRSSGWAKAFAGIATALVVVIVGVLATGVVSDGQDPNAAVVSTIAQNRSTPNDGPDATVGAAGNTEVIDDDATPMSSGLETSHESGLSWGIRIIIVVGIAASVIAFCWLMHKENRSISIMRRRKPPNARRGHAESETCGAPEENEG